MPGLRDIATKFVTLFNNLLQLEEDTNRLSKELKELKVTKERLNGLERLLIEKYESFTIEHCGGHTECQPLQGRSYHDYFKFAKERDKRIRSAAYTVTELDTW